MLQAVKNILCYDNFYLSNILKFDERYKYNLKKNCLVKIIIVSYSLPDLMAMQEEKQTTNKKQNTFEN